MKTLLSLLLLGPVASSVFADVTKEDIKALARVGMSEEFLENYIRANAPVTSFSAKDLEELRQAKVAEKILAILETGIGEKRAQPPAPRSASLPRGMVIVIPYLWSPMRLPYSAFFHGSAMQPRIGAENFFSHSPTYDYSLDPTRGDAFPGSGFSYYPTLRYYAPFYTYFTPYGFSYRPSR